MLEEMYVYGMCMCDCKCVCIWVHNEDFLVWKAKNKLIEQETTRRGLSGSPKYQNVLLCLHYEAASYFSWWPNSIISDSLITPFCVWWFTVTEILHEQMKAKALILVGFLLFLLMPGESITQHNWSREPKVSGTELHITYGSNTHYLWK